MNNPSRGYAVLVRLLIGTNNPGKVQEVRECIAHLPVELVTPDYMGITGTPKEDGVTFTENALRKAQYFYHNTLLPTIADDSGILVNALPGELGVTTRRWGLGPDVSDQEWIAYFLKKMLGVTDRRATFHSVIAFIDGEKQEHLFEGRCDGVITETLETEVPLGLPFDALFRPDSVDVVYGALTRTQKNAISHRGTALQKFCIFLATRLQ